MQTETAPNSSQLRQRSGSWSLALVLLVVVFFGLIRYLLREMPLERDEGEYAYAGQLLLQGIPPYKLAYNMKLPGIYAAYAGMLAAFGETPAGIHVGLLLVNAATTLVLYFLTALLFGRLAAVVAGSTYALLSTSSSVLGFEAHATNFVVLPAIVGLLLLLRATQSGRGWLFFLSGLFSGIAFLMKQHGIFFVFFGLLYLAWNERKQRGSLGMFLHHAGAFASGVILPYATTCWLLYRAGVFRNFWFWTVSYAGEYSKMGLHRAVRAFLESSRTVVTPAAPIWTLAAVGMSALLWSPCARRQAWFLGGLSLCSFLALCPGAYFRLHYFVLLLPATAILVGVAVSSTTEKLSRLPKPWPLALIPTLVFLASFGYAIFQQRQFYFFMDSVAAFQATYRNSPFLQAVRIGDYVREHSPETARLAVVGSEPEIYFYAKRHSATGYVYMYSLIVRQRYTVPMQEQMIQELEEHPADYLVYVDVWDSWGDRRGAWQAASFLLRLQEYMDEQYERVGVAEVGEPARYVWGDAAKTYLPHSSEVIYLLERRPNTH